MPMELEVFLESPNVSGLRFFARTHLKKSFLLHSPVWRGEREMQWAEDIARPKSDDGINCCWNGHQIRGKKNEEIEYQQKN